MSTASASARRSAETRLRARLESLHGAADAELRRRGVVPLGPPRRHGAGIPGGEPRGRLALVQSVTNPAGTGRAVSRALSRASSGLPGSSAGRRVRSELPTLLLEGTAELALRLRAITGREVIDMEALTDLIGFAYRVAELRQRHRGGDYEVDPFGFDAEWTETLLPLARIVYRRYWRVDTRGIGNVPRAGAALLVSNHSGVLPLDGAMIKTALFEEGVERHARALIADWFFSLPALSWFLRRSGQTIGHHDDTLRLLGSGELVLVFPEGVKGTGKLYKERYRLRRFGRGGFVEVAMRASVPIIPISVVGAEEIYPMLADVRPLAQLTGFPYFPVTPTWPWLGPLGLVPLPSKWSIEFHAPVEVPAVDPGETPDPNVVMQVADRVRDTIQQGLLANLMERRSVFRG